MSTKWRKYRKTYVNKHVRMFSYKKNYIKAHVLMYFLHLVLTFTPHYIIMVKGLLYVRYYIDSIIYTVYTIHEQFKYSSMIWHIEAMV